MDIIYVLDRDFNLIGIIDEYVSTIWRPSYSDIGDFEIYLGATSNAVALLCENNYVVRSSDIAVDESGNVTYKKVMIIKNIRINTDVENGDYLTVTGRELKYLLHQRIVWTQTNLSGKTDLAIKRLVNENAINPVNVNRVIPNLILEDSTIITDKNISKFFTVSNDSYYFEWTDGQFKSNNVNVDDSTAKTTLTALTDIELSFDYSYSTEEDYDLFTLTVGGTTVENEASGVGTGSHRVNLSAGDTVVFQYTKDESYPENSDQCAFYNVIASYPIKAQFDDVIDKQITGASLDKAIIDICTAYNFGWDIYVLNKTMVFTIYKGINRSYKQSKRPYVVFSDDFENLYNTEYQLNSEQYTNTTLVAGEGEGVNRITVSVGDTYSGLDRYETYTDARDISQNKDTDKEIDLATYQSLLEQRGVESLANLAYTEGFTGEVLSGMSFKYLTDFNLGDLVSVINKYGINGTVRVTSAIESEDENGKKLLPQFKSESVKFEYDTEEIISERSLFFTHTDSGFYGATINIGAGLVEGETYIVTWDDVDYIYIAEKKSGAICVGNSYLGGVGNDNGEPICVADLGNVTAFYTADSSSSHIVSISIIK